MIFVHTIALYINYTLKYFTFRHSDGWLCHERVFADEVDFASFLLGGPVIAGRRGGGSLGHEGLFVDAAEPANKISYTDLVLLIYVSISFSPKVVSDAHLLNCLWTD